jgi:hypothetical protein
MKQAKTETLRPKATEALAAITEIVLQFRDDEKPTLSGIARITGRASGLPRIQDLDERISVENAATVQIAKRHNLMS